MAQLKEAGEVKYDTFQLLRQAGYDFETMIWRRRNALRGV
jgi:hypothetical protein